MSKWFRVYDSLVDDPKVQRLPAETFKSLINLWCLASQNDGLLPPADDIAFKLRMKPERVSKLLDDLRAANLLDDDETGTRPHNWSGRQYKTDVTDPTNSARQKRYRERLRNGDGNGKSVTKTVTVKRPDTEADTEQNRNISIPSVSQGGRAATRPAVDQAFEDFWREFPKRHGSNPKSPAAAKFAAALKSGTDAAAIIEGAKRYRAECEAQKLVGTPMVAQALTWLNQRRWDDYAAAQPVNGAKPKGRDPPELPEDQWHFYQWFSSGTPEGLPPEQWQAFAEGTLNGAAKTS